MHDRISNRKTVLSTVTMVLEADAVTVLFFQGVVHLAPGGLT